MPSRPTKPKTETPDDSADQRAAEAPVDEKPTPTPDKERTAEEWEEHRAEVLARLPEEKDRPKNIYARLAQINGFIGLIRKTGVNDFHKYTYAKEADLVEEIRPMLSAYGIWLEQRLLADPERGFIPHQRLPQYKVRDNVTVDSLTVITKEFRFVWWNPDGIDFNIAPDHKGVLETTEWEPFMGYGDDTGDKGYYKAETGAVKYFLMKTFMVATGNDPEADAAVDKRAAQRDSGGYSDRRPERASGQRGPAQPGGRQQQTSQPQARQIGELLRAQGIRTTVEAITKLESLTGDKIEIKDPEEMAEALQAYIGSLSGPKAGAVIQKLREAASKPEATEEPEEKKVAAAEYAADEGSATDEASGETTSEGTIDSSIE